MARSLHEHAQAGAIHGQHVAQVDRDQLGLLVERLDDGVHERQARPQVELALDSEDDDLRRRALHLDHEAVPRAHVDRVPEGICFARFAAHRDFISGLTR